MTKSLLSGPDLTCETRPFRDALAMVSPAVPPRSPMKQLQCVFLEYTRGVGATLTATDLNIAIRCRVDGIEGAESARVLILPERLEAILRTAGEDTFRITPPEAPGGKARFLGTRWDYKLATEDPALFPEIPWVYVADHLLVQQPLLRRAFERTADAVDAKSKQYALGGCLLEFDGRREPGQLSVVATCGRRMHRQRLEAMATGSGLNGQPVLPAKAMRILASRLDDQGTNTARIAASYAGGDPSAILVDTWSFSLYSRLAEGRFPRYEEMIPAAHSTTVHAYAGALLSAVQQAMITTTDDVFGVTVEARQGGVHFSSEAPNAGASSVDLPATVEGPGAVLRINPGYLVDALERLEPGAPVTIEMLDGETAILLATEDDFLGVLATISAR